MNKVYEIKWDKSDELFCTYSEHIFKKEHYHSRIEVYYALTDGLKVNLSGRQYDMVANSFVIADSFDAHSYDGEGKFIYLIIPDKYFESYKKVKRGRRLKDNYFCQPEQCAQVKSILDDIIKLNDDGANFLQLEGIIKYLLGTIVSYTEFIDDKTYHSYDTAKEVLMFINDNFKEQLTLDKISENLGYNKHYISHLLAKVLSQPFNDYINGLRVEYFLNNIDDLSHIGEVAFESGFQSLATFYRAFDKVYGCSPKKFIKNNRLLTL